MASYDVDDIVITNATDRINNITVPHGTNNKLTVLKKFCDENNYEFDLSWYDGSGTMDKTRLTVADRIGDSSGVYALRTRSPNRNCTYVEIESNEPLTVLHGAGVVRNWGKSKITTTMQINGTVYSKLALALDTVLIGSYDGSTYYKNLPDDDLITTGDYIYVSHIPSETTFYDNAAAGQAEGSAILRIGNEYIVCDDYEDITGSVPSDLPHARGRFKVWLRGANKYGNNVGTTYTLSQITQHPNRAEVLNWGVVRATPDSTADNLIKITLASATGFTDGCDISIGDEWMSNRAASGATLFVTVRSDDLLTYDIKPVDPLYPAYAHFAGTVCINQTSTTGGPSATYRKVGSMTFENTFDYRDGLDKKIYETYLLLSVPSLVSIKPSNPPAFMAAVSVGDRLTVTDDKTNLTTATQYRFMSYELNWSNNVPDMVCYLTLDNYRSVAFDNLRRDNTLIEKLLRGKKNLSDALEGSSDFFGGLISWFKDAGAAILSEGTRLAFGASTDGSTGSTVTIHRDSSSNLVFNDGVTGEKTLAELAATGWDGGTVNNDITLQNSANINIQYISGDTDSTGEILFNTDNADVYGSIRVDENNFEFTMHGDDSPAVQAHMYFTTTRGDIKFTSWDEAIFNLGGNFTVEKTDGTDLLKVEYGGDIYFGTTKVWGEDANNDVVWSVPQVSGGLGEATHTIGDLIIDTATGLLQFAFGTGNTDTTNVVDERLELVDKYTSSELCYTDSTNNLSSLKKFSCELSENTGGYQTVYEKSTGGCQLLSFVAFGEDLDNLKVTIDGTATEIASLAQSTYVNSTYDMQDPGFEDSASANCYMYTLPPITAQTSLKIEIDLYGDDTKVACFGWVFEG